MRLARHIIFIGRVQGVGFRFTASRIAPCHQLTGFVRNTVDGKVEMLIQGEENDVNGCLTELCETFGNYIRDTKITPVPVDSGYSSFQITF